MVLLIVGIVKVVLGMMVAVVGMVLVVGSMMVVIVGVVVVGVVKEVMVWWLMLWAWLGVVGIMFGMVVRLVCTVGGS